MTALLTTVDAVKQWGSIEGPADDAKIFRLIGAASQAFETWTSRAFARTSYVDTLDGNGKTFLMLINRPIIAVSEVKVGTRLYPAKGASSTGFTHNDSLVFLHGYMFDRGCQNIQITYEAGFDTTPADVEQAIIEMVLSRYREPQAQNAASVSMAGESMSFSPGRTSFFVRETTRTYKRTAIL